MRASSPFHCVKLRSALAATAKARSGLRLPSGPPWPPSLPLPEWLWPTAGSRSGSQFACARVASVVVASGYFIRLTIWLGANSPCRVSSVRIVVSVIDPEPSCPAIGMPLTSRDVDRAAGVGVARARQAGGGRQAGPTMQRAAPSASGRCARGTRAAPARACRSPPRRPRGGRERPSSMPGSESTASSSWLLESRNTSLAVAPSRPACLWPPAGAAPRRAASSSRGSAAGSIAPGSPAGLDREAQVAVLAPRAARARDRAPCPRRRASRAAAAADDR